MASNPGTGPVFGDPGVVKKSRIDLVSRRESFGPANAFLMAARSSPAQCSLSSGPLLHASTAGSKSHPIGSEIMPSATPSLASQLLHQRVHEELAFAVGEKLVHLRLCPEASLGAAWL